ncbi:MAG: hypothetical protein NZM25_06650, partial [Leptospiraceae bacterium]|nr:hypothetical protein [Leptospiraceae bacterium]
MELEMKKHCWYFLPMFWLLRMALPMPIVAATARLSQETGNADGKMPNSGSALELWAKDKETLFHAYARRDALANGIAHLHAQAWAYAGFSSGSHLLAWGLGSHFWQRAQSGKSEQGSFSPAVGFFWQHPQFELMLAGSQ